MSDTSKTAKIIKRCILHVYGDTGLRRF